MSTKLELPANEAITPAGRLCFPSLFRKRAPKGSDKLAYEAQLLIPDGDLARLKAAIEHVVAEKWGAKRPPSLRIPLVKPGDHDMGDGWLLKCRNSNSPPAVVDRAKNPYVDWPALAQLDEDARDDTLRIAEEALYAGCWVRMHVRLFAYENASRGVSCEMIAVQFIKDDEPFGGGGRRKTADALDALDDLSGDSDEPDTEDGGSLFD